MKKIEAFIKPHKLDSVLQELNSLTEVTGLTVSDARGFGRGKPQDDEEQGAKGLEPLKPVLQIILYCADDVVETILASIQKSAHTGLRSDGKIYLLEVQDAVRISTGERGEVAV